MSLCSTSSQTPIFTKFQYFTQSGERHADEWYCNICTPHDSTHIHYMSTRAAQHHERHSVEHARNVTESEMWWNPPAPDAAAWNAPIIEDPPLTIEEMKIRESRLHVDHVQDMVPFWIRGVEAAEKGEVLRLEQFLETLQAASDAWLNAGSDNAWVEANPDQGWGDNAWGAQGDTNRGWNADNEKVGGWGFTLGADAWGVDVRSLSSADGSVDRVDAPRIRQRQRGRENKKTPKNAYDFVEEVARQEAVDEERKRRMHTFFNMPTHEKIKKIDEVIRYLQEVRFH